MLNPRGFFFLQAIVPHSHLCYRLSFALLLAAESNDPRIIETSGNLRPSFAEDERNGEKREWPRKNPVNVRTLLRAREEILKANR